jgi:signal transduction histidine kinase
MIEVNVIDSGIGIPKRSASAFRRFLPSACRPRASTGTGLTHRRRLVDGHGGTVRVRSNEPTGAIFRWCCLPGPRRALSQCWPQAR